jgi:hypothetical protein
VVDGEKVGVGSLWVFDNAPGEKPSATLIKLGARVCLSSCADVGESACAYGPSDSKYAERRLCALLPSVELGTSGCLR